MKWLVMRSKAPGLGDFGRELLLPSATAALSMFNMSHDQHQVGKACQDDAQYGAGSSSVRASVEGGITVQMRVYATGKGKSNPNKTNHCFSIATQNYSQEPWNWF